MKLPSFFFFFLMFISLFIRLHQVLVAAGGLLSCSSQAPSLWQVGSLVASCELLVAACMWDLVPWPGIEPWPPALGAQSLIHCTTREVLKLPSEGSLWESQNYPVISEIKCKKDGLFPL